jgi:hypothetical protein
VHYLTALNACQIVANNAFDGYLVEQANGPRVAADNDSILIQHQYFFTSLTVLHTPSYHLFMSGNSQGARWFLKCGRML